MGYLKRLLLQAIVVSLVLVALPSHILAQSASVNATSPVDPGGSGTASVSISAPEIGSFQLNVSCNPSGNLVFNSITPGSGPAGFTIVDNITGSDSAAVSGFMTTTPITSVTNVTNISFTVVDSPSSSTTISVSGTLYDPRGDAIPEVTLSDVTVIITSITTQNMLNTFNVAPILGGVGGGLLLLAIITIWVRRRILRIH